MLEDTGEDARSLAARCPASQSKRTESSIPDVRVSMDACGIHYSVTSRQETANRKIPINAFSCITCDAVRDAAFVIGYVSSAALAAL